MPDPTTTNRAFTIPNNGADVGTWDSPLNGNWNALDVMMGAVASIALSSNNVVLTSSAYQRGVIQFTGAIANNVTVTFPTVSGFWTIQNNCTGNGAFVIFLTCGAGRQICAAPGGQDIYADGSNMNYRNLPPVGSYLQFGANSTPQWMFKCTTPPYLNCDGTTFSSATYPQLVDFLGGTTLPDLRGRAFFTLNQGTGRVTAAFNGDVINSAGGNEQTVLGQANLPATTYNFNNTGNTFVTSVTANTSAGFGTGNKIAALGINVGGPTAPAGTIGPLGTASQFSNTPPACCGGITLIRAGG